MLGAPERVRVRKERQCQNRMVGLGLNVCFPYAQASEYWILKMLCICVSPGQTDSGNSITGLLLGNARYTFASPKLGKLR